LVGRPSGYRTQSGQSKRLELSQKNLSGQPKMCQLAIFGAIRRKSPNLEVLRAVPRLCALHPGICLTTEEKARKNLSQGIKD
jgi:hypothetical protein